MKSYKIFLTKSSDAAARIAQSYTLDNSFPADIESISRGKVNEEHRAGTSNLPRQMILLLRGYA